MCYTVFMDNGYLYIHFFAKKTKNSVMNYVILNSDVTYLSDQLDPCGFTFLLKLL